jgi:hypothetical protein
MWASAFTGAVDIYRFARNVDAFERLTAAQAPVDLVILTPAQHGPFNITPDQFVARVLEGPLGTSSCLRNLHVIVVGAPLERSHPRAMSVSTLDAAIRLVKFGEVERAPRPANLEPANVQPTASARGGSATTVDAILSDSGIAGSIISRIWDAPAPDAPDERPAAAQPRTAEVVGGGARAAAEPIEVRAAADAPANPQLFSRTVATGFIVTPPQGPTPAQAPSDAQVHAPVAAAPHAHPVMGGGAQQQLQQPQVGIPGESIEVATGVLQPARPYQLPNGAGYRGPAVRGGRIDPAQAIGASGGQPVPPALASQVQTMVYGGAVGNPGDPLLTWSSALRNGAPVPGGDAQVVATVPMQAAPVASAAPAAPAAMAPVAAHQQVRTVPLDPPAGVYGAAPAAASPAASADPFLQRAEQGGGAVSFG